jgi:hypothetical protein
VRCCDAQAKDHGQVQEAQVQEGRKEGAGGIQSHLFATAGAIHTRAVRSKQQLVVLKDRHLLRR